MNRAASLSLEHSVGCPEDSSFDESPVKSGSADDASRAAPDHGSAILGNLERAVLAVLLEHRGRVVGRIELARRAGLTGTNQRRCDSLLVNIRRALGSESLRTVRGRGWMLDPGAESAARSMVHDPLLAGTAPAD